MKEVLWLLKCKRNSCRHTWYVPVTPVNKTKARIKKLLGRAKELHHQCACEICGCKRIKTLGIVEREK